MEHLYDNQTVLEQPTTYQYLKDNLYTVAKYRKSGEL